MIQRQTTDASPSRSQSAAEICAVSYGFDEKGNIVLPDAAPFDGDPVLIKLASGWCEAWWEDGRTYETASGQESDGFQWVCMDADFTAELDDAKFWTALPVAPPVAGMLCDGCGQNQVERSGRWLRCLPRTHGSVLMSSQQLADELLRNWQALWFLPPSERVQRIDAIRKDLEFEQRQRGVEREMAHG